MSNLADRIAPSDTQTSRVTVADVNDAPTVTITVPPGAEFLVNEQVNGNQQRPAILGLSDGRTLFAWEDSSRTLGDASGTSIKGRIFSATGEPGDEFLINSQTASDQQLPAITELSGGGFVVTWMDSSFTLGDASGTSIKARIFDSAGDAVAGEFLVNDQFSNGQYQPQITALSGDRFVITWYDDSRTLGDDSELSIKARIFEGDGTPVAAEFLVNQQPANSQFWPNITTLSDGSFLIVWHDNSHTQGDADGNSTKGRIFSSAGAPLTDDFLINTQTVSDQREPAVSALANGGFVVTWEDGSGLGGDSSFYSIKAQIFNSAGTKVAGEILVNTEYFGDQRNPIVAGLEDGGFVVTWRDPSGTLGDASGQSIKARVFDAGGTATDGEFLVNEATAFSQQYPVVTALAGGGFAIAWHDQSGTLGDASGTSIKARVYEPNLATTEDAAYNLKGAISVADADAGTEALDLTLTVANGVLNVDTGTSNLHLVDGNGTSTVTFRGTIEQINAFLDSDPSSTISYMPNPDYNGSDTLTVTANDGGATGQDPGGPHPSSEEGVATATIDVSAVNDQPQLSLNGLIGPASTLAYDEDDGASALAPNATFSDVDWEDAAGGKLTVKFDQNGAAEDALGILDVGGITRIAGNVFYNNVDIGDVTGGAAGGADLVVTLDGDSTAAAVEALIRAVSYDNGSQDPSTASRVVNFLIDDEDGGSSTSTGNATVNISSVEDAPTGGVDSKTTDEQSSTDIDVLANDGDVDGPAPSIEEIDGETPVVGTAIALDSGGTVTLNNLGTLTYDPNGAFDRTPTPGSGALNTPASDSFQYKLTGGGLVTVTVTITGIDTNDLLIGASGSALAGGTGNDVYRIHFGNIAITENGGEGADRVTAAVSYTLADGVSVETLSTVNAASTAAVDLTGNDLANSVHGNAGDNDLSGGGGNDLLCGLAGADLLDGNAGADNMRGGDGGDAYYIDDAGDRVLELLNQGSDTVYASTSYTLTGGAHVESLRTTNDAGTGAITLNGNELDQTLTGNAGANVLNGRGGTDHLVGLLGNDVYGVDNASDTIAEAVGQGDDRLSASASYTLAAGISVETMGTSDGGGTSAIDLTGNEFGQSLYGNEGMNALSGGSGNDSLHGLGGTDTLYGGVGLDNLRGGAGEDGFVFDAALVAGNVDRIIDFSVADDTILLENAIFMELSAGALPAGAFHIGSAAADADDRIIYDSASGALYYDADGSDASSAQILFARLDSGPALTGADFLVI